MADGNPKNEFMFAPASREGIRALVLLYGLSGCGKTYSALRMARGLVGPKGKIAMLDTEHNRGRHYADEFQFSHCEMVAPFSPARYLQALIACEQQGFDCLIVDSISHVQEGEGGLIDMAEAIGATMRADSFAKWAKPKAEWKRVRNRFLQSSMHIIFCARGKEPLEESEGDRKKMQRGELVPIIPRDFQYEVTVSLGLEVETHRIIPTKLPDQLAGAFPLDEFITEDSGRAMSAWLDGKPVIDDALEEAKAAGEAAARRGMKALESWWRSLNEKTQTRVRADLRDRLKPMAQQVERQRAEGEGEQKPEPEPDGAEDAPAPNAARLDDRALNALAYDILQAVNEMSAAQAQKYLRERAEDMRAIEEAEPPVAKMIRAAAGQ